MQFTILGPLRAWRDDRELPYIGPPKQRIALALLLAQAGRPVGIHQLVDALWPEAPPDSARNVVHRHVGSLRRLLEPELASRADARRLIRLGEGYRLDLQTDELDLLRFRVLREQARSAAGDASGQEAAVALLIEALSLWRGRCGAQLPHAFSAHPVISAINSEYSAAAREAADAALAAGCAEQVLPVVGHAAATEPYDEGLHARLILVLSAAGHQAEALDHYRTVRSRLSVDLGLDVGPALSAAQRQVLQSYEAGPAGSHTAAKPATRPHPAQLPRDLDTFAGRRPELERLQALLRVRGHAPGDAAVITAIGGAPGVGKTTLAIHWAHRVAPQYPDGQLYVDLRGYDPDGAVLPPHEAVLCFLDALGVQPAEVPADFDAQVGLYRSLLAGRRVLVVLDNARDAEQVRPLLPGANGSLTLVTSRSQFLGLVASEGARSLSLDVLSERESVQLLAGRLGDRRVRDEPEAARAIARLCGNLPLALAIVCARASMYPKCPLSVFLKELQEGQGSLDAFATDDPATDARSVFSWSCRTLSPDAARMFRLLSLCPAPQISLQAAVGLAGVGLRVARSALGELIRAQLWLEPVPGRFTAHDLIRAYGREMANAQDSETERDSARCRVVDHYLYSAYAADTLLAPHRERIILPPPADGAAPLRFEDPEQARAWLTAELPVLLAVVESDAEYPSDDAHAWRLAAVLEQFLDRLGRRQEQLHLQCRGLAAAERLGDPVGRANCHRALGFALGRVERYSEAEMHLRRAEELHEQNADLVGQARTCRFLAFLANVRKAHPAALEMYTRAADLYARAGQGGENAALANDVGWTYILLGDHEKALDECARAVGLAQQIGDLNVEAAAWDSIGVARHHLGRQDEALEAYGRALALYREISDAYLTADTLVHIGDTHWACGASTAARHAWQQARAILEELAHPDLEAVRARLVQAPARGDAATAG